MLLQRDVFNMLVKILVKIFFINNTNNVLMLRRLAKVPLANERILLSYRDNKVRLVKSLNRSVRMHDISLAFSNLKQ